MSGLPGGLRRFFSWGARRTHPLLLVSAPAGSNVIQGRPGPKGNEMHQMQMQKAKETEKGILYDPGDLAMNPEYRPWVRLSMAIIAQAARDAKKGSAQTRMEARAWMLNEGAALLRLLGKDGLAEKMRAWVQSGCPRTRGTRRKFPLEYVDRSQD